MRLLSVLALVFTFIAAAPAQAAVIAQLDRTRIIDGETVTLTLEVDGQSQAEPDLSVLNRDFEILNRSSGTQMSVINGRMSSATTWTLMLRPKRTGKLTVPAIPVGSDSSKPLTVQVTDAASAAADGTAPNILVETAVDRKSPYVQGMALYTVRVLTAVHIDQASLTEPDIDNAIVQRLGEDRTDTVTRGGVSYQMIERQYAILPQKSGKLVLPAPVLDAQVPDRQRRQQGPRSIFDNDPFFDPFLRSTPLKSVRVRGKEQVLTVKPRPAAAKGASWLPADDIYMSEDWQPEDGSVQAGDPITRTVTINAAGLTGAQLPDLSPGSVPGVKIYPDKAKAETSASNDVLVGRKTQSIAYVPTRAGTFTLPAIEIKWWDVKKDQARTATLPARTVTVAPASGAAAAPPPPAASEVPAAPTAPPAPPAPQDVGLGQSSAGGHFWFLVSLGLAALWLATTALWILDRTRKRAAPAPAPADRPDSGAARSRFLTACRSGNAGLARRSLLDWAARHWPENPPKDLDDLAARLPDPAQRDLVRALDRAVYGSSTGTWDGADLARSLTSLPDSKDARRTGSALPELYPDARPKRR